MLNRTLTAVLNCRSHPEGHCCIPADDFTHIYSTWIELMSHQEAQYDMRTVVALAQKDPDEEEPSQDDFLPIEWKWR